MMSLNSHTHVAICACARVNSPHKGQVRWKVFPFDDVIMIRDFSDQSVSRKVGFPIGRVEVAGLFRNVKDNPYHYNGRLNCVSNHQPHDCLLNRLFRRRSKKTSKLRVTGLCAGNSRGTANFPHKWPVTRKRFPYDDVIMCCSLSSIITVISLFRLLCGEVILN